MDAHVAGQALRLIVGGFPAVAGADMWERQQAAEADADHLRLALMLEPRGHADMSGAVLTEPVSADAHAGVLFMDAGGFHPMSAHGAIATAAIAVERGLITTRAPGEAIVLDTAAGRVRVARSESAEPSWVLTSTPSFVLHAGVSVTIPGRRLLADVAFGGCFYAVVDSEAAGVGMTAAHLPDLRRVGAQIAAAVGAALVVQHPLEPRLRGLRGTVFTGPAAEGADLRTVAVRANGAVDRSPSGTGASAVLAVLSAMGLLTPHTPLVCESLIGSRFLGRIASRTTVGNRDAIVPEIDATASITGEHTFYVDRDAAADPLGAGFDV